MAGYSNRTSPRLVARVAGWLYLVVIAGGLFAEVGVRQQLAVPGDASSTATNIIAGEALFRAGTAINLLYLQANIPFAVIVYYLFKRAHQNIALLTALLIVATTTIEAVNLFHLMTLLDILLGPSLGALSELQRHALAYAELQAFNSGFAVSLVFFGGVCLCYASLIIRSGFVPRSIGILIALAGLCYLVNSFALVAKPDLAALLFPYILLPSLLGEVCLALWLAVIGIDEQRWRDAGQDRASGAAAGS